MELVEPPAGAAIGERVYVEGFPGEPDEQLNPKKKIWEAVSAQEVLLCSLFVCLFVVVFVLWVRERGHTRGWGGWGGVGIW